MRADHAVSVFLFGCVLLLFGWNAKAIENFREELIRWRNMFSGRMMGWFPVPTRHVQREGRLPEQNFMLAAGLTLIVVSALAMFTR